MTRDERHRWLFAKMDGRRITFEQKGMPFRVMRPNAVVGCDVYIKDTKCRVRIVHKKEAENGKRYEIRFPDKEWKRIGADEAGNDIWTSNVKLEETTLIGYMEITGNWKNKEGKCIFHPIGNR